MKFESPVEPSPQVEDLKNEKNENSETYLLELAELHKGAEGLSKEERTKVLRQKFVILDKALGKKVHITNVEEKARVQRAAVRWAISLREEAGELAKSWPQEFRDKGEEMLRKFDDACDEAFVKLGEKVIDPLVDKMVDFLDRVFD